MTGLITAVILGVAAFVATNIDDLCILILFFSQNNLNYRPRHIITGQYLGFVVLVTISVLGFFGTTVMPRQWIGFIGLVPVGVGVHRLFVRRMPTVNTLFTTGHLNIRFGNRIIAPIISVLYSPQTYGVAAITIANGGDNIGIYIPLFSSVNHFQMIVIVIVLFLLVSLWCYVGYKLAHYFAIAKVLDQYGHIIMPFVLIGLGVLIIIESDTIKLITG